MVTDARDTAGPAVIGWREWVTLPGLGVEWVKAKVDTGARTSALHAVDLAFVEQDGQELVSFVVHPWQESESDPVSCLAPVVDARDVRSSSGHAEQRPVIVTPIRLGGRTVDVELTLTNRDDMGFRMLLGRQALKRRFLVDSAGSYLVGRPPSDVRHRNRASS